MTALAQLQVKDQAAAEAATTQGIASWKKNPRNHWSRTDTARWLNDRGEAALAWLRRRPGEWPPRSKQVGYWLKEYAPRVFDRAHARLLAGETDDDRRAMLPGEVLR